MITTGITTALNVDIDVLPANIGQRFGAFIIDWLIIITAVLGLLVIQVLVASINPGVGSGLVYFLPLVVLGYPLASEVLMNGQTLGKRALNIRVIRVDGLQLRFFDSIIRLLFLFIEVFGTSGGLATITILLSKRSQRLGDIVAGTMVVKIPPLVSLATVLALIPTDQADTSALTFPSVSRLTDTEVDVIRTMLEHTAKSTVALDVRISSVWRLRDAVARKLGVDSQMGATEFLQTVLQDYAVLRG